MTPTKTEKDAKDEAHWSAIEDVAELLVEKREVEALIALRAVIR